MNTQHIVTLALSLIATISYAQAPAAAPRPNPFLDRKAPADIVPGLVARTVIGGSPYKGPTQVVSVISSGRDYNDRAKALATAELRGTTDVSWAQYEASGYIVLDTDGEVTFDLDNVQADVNGKDFGTGKYSQKLKKGKHPILIKRSDWAKPQGDFKVTNSTTGQSVLFYTDALLKKELARSIKLDGKTMRSKLVGEVPAAAAAK